MKTTIIIASMILLPGFANACGFCKGDKAASVYSYENKKKAEKRGANYVSAEIAGISSESEFKLALRALKTIEGVVPESVNGSFEQKAVSFIHEKDIDFSNIEEAFFKKNPATNLKKVSEIN
ncbi:MAG: hypothetical protein SGI74_13935 [Oligoflexia bacterium]|nr:hypothetical protein [Oligoflexia bacterium]